MMAQKALLFEDFKIFEKIIQADTPGKAKALGRDVMNFDEVEWNENKSRIVVTGNIHKFNQHPKLLEYLLGTKLHVLVEASPTDKIWGIGLSKEAENIGNPHFWNGQNLLGFALMEVRDFFQQHGQFRYPELPVKLPWIAYPEIHPYDIFWRMGPGEDLIIRFSGYYEQLSENEKMIVRLAYPRPSGWSKFYDEDDF